MTVPTDLSGLAVWFDATQLALADGAAVTSWPNPGSGADPTFHGPSSPTLETNELNGRPIVRFTHDQSAMRITSSSGIDKDFTVIYVARLTNLSFCGRVVGAQIATTSPNLLLGFWASSPPVGFQDIGYAGGSPGGFFTPDASVAATTEWQLYSADAQTSGYQPRLFNDGVLLSSALATATDGFAGTFAISGPYSSGDATPLSETCDCEVAEVIAYSRKLSDAERQQIEGYLTTKWFGATAVNVLVPRHGAGMGHW